MRAASLCAVVAEQPLRTDAVPVEQPRRMARVLAEHDVGLRELAQHAQRDVVEVADRRRADRERHARPATRLEGDQAGADQPRLGAELGRDDADDVTPRVERLGCDDRTGRTEEQLARAPEAAADDDHLRDEDVDERDHARTEVASDAGERLDRPLVAGLAGVDERAAVVVAERAGDPVGRAPGRERLEVAAPRAGAAARRPVDFDHHVPELGACSVPAAVRAPVEDEPTADARAEREHDEIARAAPGAELPLGDGGDVAVVVDDDGDADPLLEVPGEVDAGERHVHGPDDPARDLVDPATGRRSRRPRQGCRRCAPARSPRGRPETPAATPAGSAARGDRRWIRRPRRGPPPIFVPPTSIPIAGRDVQGRRLI